MGVDFEALVRQKLDKFLLSKGFHFDRLSSQSDGARSVVLYTSRAHKIAIYRSVKDGEVNCLIGANDADVCSLGSSKEWAYLFSILHQRREMSLEELLARVPDAPKGTAEQLGEIARVLMQRFDEVVYR